MEKQNTFKKIKENAATEKRMEKKNRNIRNNSNELIKILSSISTNYTQISITRGKRVKRWKSTQKKKNGEGVGKV